MKIITNNYNVDIVEIWLFVRTTELILLIISYLVIIFLINYSNPDVFVRELKKLLEIFFPTKIDFFIFIIIVMVIKYDKYKCKS